MREEDYQRYKRMNNTPDWIEEKVEEVVSLTESVEFLHGVPVKLPNDYRAALRGKVRTALIEAAKRGIEAERREIVEWANKNASEVGIKLPDGTLTVEKVVRLSHLTTK